MIEEQLKEKEKLEKQLDKLTEQEARLRRKLHVLSFLESIEHVERQFKSDYINEYTIVIEKGNKLDIKTRANNDLLKHEVVFVLPNEYSSKLIEILKVAANNEISK